MESVVLELIVPFCDQVSLVRFSCHILRIIFCWRMVDNRRLALGKIFILSLHCLCGASNQLLVYSMLQFHTYPYIIIYGNECRMLNLNLNFLAGVSRLIFLKILGMRVLQADSLIENLKMVAYNFTIYTTSYW